MISLDAKYKVVYERSCYISMFSQLKSFLTDSDNFNAMVTGNPGIGKSYFYVYVIFMLLKNPDVLKGRRLLINSGKDFHLLDSTGTIFNRVHSASVRGDRDILRLVDGATTPGDMCGWAGCTILFASRTDGSYDKPSTMMKNHEANFFTMDVWTIEELLIANSLLPTDLRQSNEDVVNKVQLAGPIPRSVLLKATTLEDLKSTIVSTINSGILLELLSFVSRQLPIKVNNYSNTLLMMLSKSDQRCAVSNYYLNFLSTEISELILEAAKDEVLASFKKLHIVIVIQTLGRFVIASTSTSCTRGLARDSSRRS